MVQSPGEFAQQLRTLREGQGLSMRALAGLVGVSSVTIWKWEKGDSKPRARLLGPLAKALDVLPGQLRISTESPGQAAGLAADADEEASGGPGSGGLVLEDGETLATTEPLSDVIARAKQMIAEASGTGSNSITILIEY